MKQSDSQQFDAIVIGSGMGGLTTASLLAQVAHKRVLILERHFKAGGFTHSFRRERYQWDVGLHYVGDMQPGSMSRNVMDFITAGAVQWYPIGSPIEQYLFPDARFDVPSDPIAFRDALIDRFPKERPAIVQYFSDVQLAKSWMSRWFVSKVCSQLLGNVLTAFGGRLARMTTAEYMDSRFQDPLLKSILCGQWLDYGTPPLESAFGFHALIVADYLKGGFYPVGGSAEIAKAVVGIVEACGGSCMVNHRATEILIEQGKATGVRAEHQGQSVEFRAPLVVSNASAATTFGQLVKSGLAAPERSNWREYQVEHQRWCFFWGYQRIPVNAASTLATIGCSAHAIIQSQRERAEAERLRKVFNSSLFPLDRCAIQDKTRMLARSSALPMTRRGEISRAPNGRNEANATKIAKSFGPKRSWTSFTNICPNLSQSFSSKSFQLGLQ